MISVNQQTIIATHAQSLIRAHLWLVSRRHRVQFMIVSFTRPNRFTNLLVVIKLSIMLNITYYCLFIATKWNYLSGKDYLHHSIRPRLV